jgi:diaminopropionate ammonia-lyase
MTPRVIDVLVNPDARLDLADRPTRHPLDFHRRLPGYAPTPLHDIPALAAAMGVGAVLVKDESSRLGLPAFTIAGPPWPVYGRWTTPSRPATRTSCSSRAASARRWSFWAIRAA